MILLLMIGLHLLADFYLQNDRQAANKNHSVIALLQHSLQYFCAMLVVLIWYGPVSMSLLALIMLTISHGLIDFAKIEFQKWYSKRHKKTGDQVELASFIIDQALHLAVILSASFFISALNPIGYRFKVFLTQYMTISTLHNILIIAILSLIIWKPSAVLIRLIFKTFDLQNDMNVEKSSNPAKLAKNGTFIGALERTIILILGLNSQLGAIGFVLAAKSLARFSQLNDREFAEKYLIGTFSSVIIALLCIMIGNKLLT